ncbi:MAG TPA: hypothetical protein ENH82_13150 [bacterium]|nr:hypothetical protein [bacterium]
MPYAQGTEVSTDKSKTELKKIIYRFGASNYQFAESDEKAMVQFIIGNRMIRFMLHFLPPDSQMFAKTPTGRSRKKNAAFDEYEKETRRRWRALILCIKAKFETVESGIATFEEEFLAHIVLPNNETVATEMIPMITEAYKTKKMPKLLEFG